MIPLGSDFLVLRKESLDGRLNLEVTIIYDGVLTEVGDEVICRGGDGGTFMQIVPWCSVEDECAHSHKDDVDWGSKLPYERQIQ